jgi:hypothetical protein
MPGKTIVRGVLTGGFDIPGKTLPVVDCGRSF